MVQHPTSSHAPTLDDQDLQRLQNSSTSHFRNLSRFARNGDGEDLSIATAAPSVAGLSGRRQLKRTDSNRNAGGANRSGRHGSAWGERNWMDKQRQFLQAYEYLCHIGEAKEWIEDIIHKQIPPIVQLEEALRDGVTLAEIVQALYPSRPLRIFRNPKLQFRHSDNIALFFRFVAEVELPELFRFELIDLYEKKNIPKVIYCIHALSWLLYRKGIVDFRIGNLVGQLEFEHHELEAMQKGLDKAGVSMPSFSGMGASFGAEPEPEPEPEPVESEEDRIDRELVEQEATIVDFQAQARGCLERIRLGQTMNQLWDTEQTIVYLQSRIRGDWARQVADYRLNMRRFAVNLQSSMRGFLVRSNQRCREDGWKTNQSNIVKLQSLVRARKARDEVQLFRSNLRKESAGVRLFQAAVRGAMQRKRVEDQYEETASASKDVVQMQAAIRGMLARHEIQQDRTRLSHQAVQIARFQALARACATRQRLTKQADRLQSLSRLWSAFQASARGGLYRRSLDELRRRLRAHSTAFTNLQAAIRASEVRQELIATKAELAQQAPSVMKVQSSIRGYLLRQQQNRQRELLQSHCKAITQLQALSRACLYRKQVQTLLDELDGAEPEVMMLQSLARALLERARVGRLLSELEEQEAFVEELQALARGNIVRQRFVEKKKFYKENMEKVIKVQSFVRGRIQGEAYKSLTSGKNPPVGTVKNFVHLLNDSDFDFDEEIEFEQLRKTVVQHVRQNELADQYITQLDIKIALLVKNKITLDEVVRHQKHFGGHVGALLPNRDVASKDGLDLKALNKTSRRKLEQYQELFFLLQTQPQYLARFFRRIREQATAEKDAERMKHLMMGLFGYAQKRREEYYLVKLIVRSMKEEVEASPSIQEYMRSNFFFNKLFTVYSRSPRDRKFMRDLLGPIIKENVIDNAGLDLESDPLQIYQSAINNEELRTGQRSRRIPDIPREDAIRDPETRETFIRHLQDLRDICDQIFAALEDFLHRMPYGVRFTAQQTYHALCSRFPGEDPGFLLQHVGSWVWRNYLHPALIEPEKFGAVDRGLSPEHKRNLGEVAKVLGQVATGKLFGGENIYLQPLNTYVGASIQRLGDIWDHCKYPR